MAADGVRDMPNHREALGHELADCLWSVLVLAKAHDVDLEHEFDRCMDPLETPIKEQLYRCSNWACLLEHFASRRDCRLLPGAKMPVTRVQSPCRPSSPAGSRRHGVPPP